MQLVWHDELLWFALAFALPAWLAGRAFRQRASSSEVVYGWVLTAHCAWTVGQACELALVGAEAKVWADGLQYFPMCAAGALGLVFVHRFTGLPLPRRALAAYAGIAGTLSLFFATAPLHHLARQDAHIVPGQPFDALMYSYSSLDSVLILLFFFTGLYSVLILVRYLAQVSRTQLGSALPITVGFSLPTVGGLLGLGSGMQILGQRDFSFALGAVSALAVSYGISKRRHLVAVPVARELAFDRIPVAALVLDPDDVVLEMNQTAADLLGVANAAAGIGRALEDFAAWGFTARLLASFENDSNVIESRGRMFEVLVQVLGDVGARLVIVRDVTEQHQAQQVLEAHRDDLARRVEEESLKLDTTERKFRAIFDQTFQLMGVLGIDGTLLEANAPALFLLGLKAEDVLGQPFWETPWWRHSPELRQKLKAGITRAGQGEFVRFEASHALADGQLRFVDFSLNPVADASGRVSMLVAEGRDITDLRRAEEQLRQGQKMEALGRLAGGVAHDFNNLLTVITGNLSLAREESMPGVAVECLEQAETAALSAAALTGQLLAFGRKSVTITHNLAVLTEIDRLMGLLKRLLPETVTIRRLAGEGIWPIRFDETQLHQVLMNLAINARDAMPSGGQLTFEVANVHRAPPGGAQGDSQEWVQVLVKDNGVGMSEEQQRHIFEPFFTTKWEGQGTGLGLSIVYGAVTQHGGFVEVSSVPGQGSCFSLYFPRSRAADPGRITMAPAAAAPSRQGQHVYLVEDEALVRTTITKVLRRRGYQVTEFPSATDLAAAFDELVPPDLVLTDTVLPGLSGYELLQALRARWPQVPVVLMSGYAEDGRLTEEVARGVAFVGKPFTPGALIAVLERSLTAN